MQMEGALAVAAMVEEVVEGAVAAGDPALRIARGQDVGGDVEQRRSGTARNRRDRAGSAMRSAG